MDQVKTFLAALKKHHFWVLCGLAVLIGLGMTVSARNKLLTGPGGYEEEKGKISSAQSSVAPLATGTDHPNQKWVDDVKAKTEASRLEVYKAWEKLYQDQAKNVFVWPAADPTDDPAFLKEFAAADDQTEKKLDRNRLKELGDRYISYIAKTTLPRLASIIDAEWTVVDEKDAARNARGVGADGAAAAESVSHKMTWDQADQERKVEDYNWDERPSRLDMQYTQEEMWVMEALFNSIKRANSNAKGSYDAAVRQLTEVLVGYDATNRYPLGEGAGRIIRTTRTLIPGVGSSVPTGGESSAPARTMIDPKRPDRKNGVAGGGGSSGVRPTTGRSAPSFAVDPSAPVGPEAAGDPTAWLKDGRYVNAKCQPLLGSELQSSTTPEYKLMAFRLRLVVDEAQYPRIIEELASSVLPIEVREVRILPNGQNVGQSAPVGRPMPGRGNGGRPLGPRDSSAPTMSAPRARPVAPTPSSAPSEGGTSHNVPLEIYGVVYLIERPDPKKLNLPDTSAAATAASTPTGTATTGATTSTETPAAAGTASTATASAPSTTAATDATAPAAATTEPPPATGGATSTTADTAKGNGAGPAPATSVPPSVAPK